MNTSESVRETDRVLEQTKMRNVLKGRVIEAATTLCSPVRHTNDVIELASDTTESERQAENTSESVRQTDRIVEPAESVRHVEKTSETVRQTVRDIEAATTQCSSVRQTEGVIE